MRHLLHKRSLCATLSIPSEVFPWILHQTFSHTNSKIAWSSSNRANYSNTSAKVLLEEFIFLYFLSLESSSGMGKTMARGPYVAH